MDDIMNYMILSIHYLFAPCRALAAGLALETLLGGPLPPSVRTHERTRHESTSLYSLRVLLSVLYIPHYSLAIQLSIIN